MRELWLVISFRLKVLFRSMFRLRGGSLALTIVGVTGLGVFMAVMAFGFFTVYKLLSKISPENALNLFALQASAFGFLIILQVIPTMATDLFDQMGFFRVFLFYPIRRWVLLLAVFVGSVSAALLPMMIFIPTIAGFALGMGNLGSFVGVAAYLIFLSGLAFFGAVLTTKILNMSAIKKFARWIGVLNIILFVIYVNLFNGQFGEANSLPMRIFNRTATNPTLASILTVMKLVFSGDPVFCVIFALLGGYLAFRGIKFADNLKFDFSVPHRRPAAKTAKLGWRFRRNPWLWRDFMMFLRDSEIYILYVYPVIFGVFLGFMQGKSGFLGIMYAALMASQGAMIATVKILAEDIRNRQWTGTLPVDMARVFERRAVVMSTIWFPPMMVVYIVAVVWLKSPLTLGISLLPAWIAITGNCLIAQHHGADKLLSGVDRPRNAVGLYGIGLSLVPALAAVLPGVGSILKKQYPALYASLTLWGTIAGLAIAGAYTAIIFLAYRGTDAKKYFR